MVFIFSFVLANGALSVHGTRSDRSAMVSRACLCALPCTQEPTHLCVTPVAATACFTSLYSQIAQSFGFSNSLNSLQ